MDEDLVTEISNQYEFKYFRVKFGVITWVSIDKIIFINKLIKNNYFPCLFLPVSTERWQVIDVRNKCRTAVPRTYRGIQGLLEIGSCQP